MATRVTLYKIDPLADQRWGELLKRHPKASIFHSVGWLKSLRDSYGYKPVVYTTSPAGEELANGMAFCEIRSTLTGKRLISLPFSDHCAPLINSDEGLKAIIDGLNQERYRERWKYVEFRLPEIIDGSEDTGLKVCESFALHVMNLQYRNTDELFRAMHKSSVRDRVRRAEREGVTCNKGRSEQLLKSFYKLLLGTRRRHGIPPQPFEWFRNLMTYLGNNLDIYLASKDDQPIASIITLTFKDIGMYKYGCSDSRFHNLGGMPLLLWNSIQDANTNQLRTYDMGRTDLNNVSLMDFKQRIGATPSMMNYYRFPGNSVTTNRGLTQRTLQRIVSSSPDVVLRLLGNVLYRHVG